MAASLSGWVVPCRRHSRTDALGDPGSRGHRLCRIGRRTGSGGPLHTSGFPRRLCHSRDNAASGLGPDLGVLDHDGDRRRAVPRHRTQRIGRAARPVGPCRRDHLPGVRSGAARVRDCVHFAFGHDRFRLRAGYLHRRQPGSQALWVVQSPRRDPLPALAPHWAVGSGQLDNLRHRGREPGAVVHH